MNEIYGRGERIGSSAFTSTYEPTNPPINMDRILLEAHTTRSRKTSVIEDLSSESIRNEFSLVTIICSVPPVDMSWRFGIAVMVELSYGASASGEKAHLINAKQYTLRIDDIAYVADSTGSRRDNFGDWEWTLNVSSVPLRLADQTVQGKVRISGRELPVPWEFRTIGLEEYWEGRHKLLLEETN